MQNVHRLAVPRAALALLVSATAYAGSQQGHYGAAWSLTHPKNFHNGGKQSCERKRLQATRKYTKCFQEIESAVLTRGLTLQEQEERIEVCAGRLTRDLERASRTAGEDECAVPVDVDELRGTLDNAERVAFQLTTGFEDLSCTSQGDDGATKRCVTRASQTLNLKELMELIGMESRDPSQVLITAEIYGGKGKPGDADPGNRGYARTTWTWQAFQDNDKSDLYLYVGERPSCKSCGGASSMVLFNPVTDITDPLDPTTQVFGIAGGSGGGGRDNGTIYGKDAHRGGRGGYAIATDTEIVYAAGGDGGAGGQSGSGGGGNRLGFGGGGSRSCDKATRGTSGVGGFGGIVSNDKERDRAGWRSSDLTISRWEYGAGGTGKDSIANGGAGGGGHGGGGGACNRGGGGGGGSMVVGLNGVDTDTDELPAYCGEKNMPDMDGKCGKGNGDGRIVLDIRSQ